MKIILSTVSVLVMLCGNALQAQDNSTDHKTPHLPGNIEFSDLDHNDSLSKEEVRTVFQQYFNNPARNVPSELVSDVESVVIDLIGYLENVNCSALKRTEGSKRFIELYFADRFVATH